LPKKLQEVGCGGKNNILERGFCRIITSMLYLTSVAAADYTKT